MSILDSLYNELTRKAQIANKDITREIIEDWVRDAGDESQQIAFISAVLSELSSGRVTPEQMVGNILQLANMDN
ncbi:MAG TPA: hypothetical protein VJ508_16160 [Saprospiraceae bacterium]|nr:hypothetical protein [Saprospiraceae bacterium]